MEIALSVVVPTRDRPILARRALTSIAKQGRDDIEVVMVDDGSRARYDLNGIIHPSRLTSIRNEASGGAAAARNSGIQMAKGKWIAFLDDDDEWEDGFVDATLTRLEGVESSMVFSWCSINNVCYDTNGGITEHRARVFKAIYDEREQLFSEALSIGTSWGLTVNRRCFDEVGLFDPSYKLTEDTEFIFRLLSRGCEPVVVPEILVKIHNHSDEARLSSIKRNPDRISECKRLMNEYSEFMCRYPMARDGLRSHIVKLENGDQ
ncbi:MULTISPECIES: glycosyltransferase family A protein [unclassified Bradyrhizobium]|uniref:glycosyltransferase family 2 protein n=1 Tax=unclassified Bradyrhizobium TaxID=2631580 RepID=UPI00291675E8|nr:MULTISPECIES: glycosyltransferase family A protein [unclassified Bradyrhizobium]